MMTSPHRNWGALASGCCCATWITPWLPRDPAALCRDVWRECGNRGYGGVLADFERPPSEDRTAFLEALTDGR